MYSKVQEKVKRVASSECASTKQGYWPTPPNPIHRICVMCILFQHCSRLRGATARKERWNCQTHALYVYFFRDHTLFYKKRLLCVAVKTGFGMVFAGFCPMFGTLNPTLRYHARPLAVREAWGHGRPRKGPKVSNIYSTSSSEAWHQLCSCWMLRIVEPTGLSMFIRA